MAGRVRSRKHNPLPCRASSSAMGDLMRGENSVIKKTRRGNNIRRQGISKEELKGLMEETLIDVLTKRRDLLEDAVADAILDMKLAEAIQKGDKGEYVPENEIIAKLLP